MSRPLAMLSIDNAFARATISLYGGQVLGFCPKHDGRERLFVSSKAMLDGSKSIRGGIPLCWPWFGAWQGAATVAATATATATTATPLPAHGYARNRHWQVVDIVEQAEATVVTLQLRNAAGAGFTGSARVEAVLVIGSTLSVSLRTTNCGTEAFQLSAALHTYFAIDDVRTLSLQGLSGTYSDKTRAWALLPTPTPYRLTEATDRIHLVPVQQVTIVSTAGNTVMHSQGHDSVVVWNPWDTGSSAFTDLAPADYLKFICVETALTQGFTLRPGQTHCLQQTIG